jgi:hypothetical protein
MREKRIFEQEKNIIIKDLKNKKDKIQELENRLIESESKRERLE